MIDFEALSVEELVEVLQEQSDRYYNDGESDLTDAEYDAMEAYLREIDPMNPFLLGVGATERGEKVPLPVPMGSLDQIYDEEVQAWAKKIGDNEQFTVTEKLDGTSALLVYDQSGNLQIAYSRGNGTEGADITRHMRRIKSVPQKTIGEMIVRAEVILPKSTEKSVREQVGKKTQREYKNARNFVAGQMNKKESFDEFYDHVKVVAYDIIRPETEYKQDQIDILDRAGFEVAESWTVFGKELTDEVLKALIESQRKNGDFEIDGVVVEIDSLKVRKQQTQRSNTLNPAWARKFKSGGDDNIAQAVVTQVHWNASKHGYLKPRVEIQPVDLVGVTIKFATGFNAKFVKEQGIGPGAVIQITRSGDVIPFIQKVIKPVTPQLPEGFGDLKWSENQVDLILVEETDDVEFERLKYFFGKLGVEHAGGGNIRKAFDTGFRNPEACVKMTEEEWKSTVGQSAGSKIFKNLKKCLNPVKIAVLAAASGIFERGIGERKLQPVIDKFGILNISIIQMLEVEGIQQRTAEKISEGLKEFEILLSNITGFYTLEQSQKPVEGGSLSGEYVVFTGVRSKELEETLVKNGAEVGSSMSKCTILVAKDPNSTSGKAQKAREAGIRIISLDQATKLV